VEAGKNVHGLTGSIACGKTTVANFFKESGIPVIDLDNVSREVVKPGSIGLKTIIDTFGNEYLTTNGSLNRKKLGELIFNDKKAKKKLEQIIHPLIFKRKKEIIENLRGKYGEIPVIIDAALMIETKTYKNYNKLIVVYVPENIQISRLMKRDNLTYEEALKRVKSQMSIEEKIKFAHYVIDNSKDIEYTKKQVYKIAEELKSASKS
jgi:dephospho-CoA kinase